jgi:hypothetical protein
MTGLIAKSLTLLALKPQLGTMFMLAAGGVGQASAAD